MKFARRVGWVKRTLWSLAGCTTASPLPGGGRTADITLTFDDGPHPVHTPAVLDRLAAYRLRAAFFLVGNRVVDDSLVARIAEEGHLIGNHTFSHERPRLGHISSSLADVRRCQGLLPGATLFRPPFGRLTPGLWLAAELLGLRSVYWSLDSGDWKCRNAADAVACAEELSRCARPGDVILFHDDHRWIVPILDRVLPHLFAANTVDSRSIRPEIVPSAARPLDGVAGAMESVGTPGLAAADVSPKGI